jgi:DNA primase
MKDLSSLNNPVAEDYYLQSLSTKTNISKESIVKRYEMVANKKGPAKKYQAKKVAGKQPKTEWSSRTKVMINFAVKEKMDYKNEMAKNYDRLIDDKKVMAFNSHKILSRQDILKHYLDQKGKVLETTITMIGDKDMDSIAQGVVETAVDNISKSLGIPRANMDYVAFLHKDTKHPHIHLQCCQKETYLNQYDLKTDLVNSLVKDIGQHINDNMKEVVVEQPVVPKMAI